MSRSRPLLRFLGAPLSLAVLAVLLVGCRTEEERRSPRDDTAEARIAALERAVDAASDGVGRDIAAAIGVELDRGRRRFGHCGEDYAPLGVQVREHLLFRGPAAGVAEVMVETAARVLEEGGWTVEHPGNPRIVIGTSGNVEVRFQGGAFPQIDIANADCLETDDDVAREFADRASEVVEW